MAAKKESNSLEEVFDQLEAVIGQLEADIPLEESFALYHKGMDMLKVCNDKIEKVEKKIQVLDEEGNRKEF